MRHLLSAACGLVLICAFAGQGSAEDLAGKTAETATATNPVVVEMFTSQGCVACPPADEFFASLTRDKRVIALSLHIDYWDYIGWEDSFGSSRFTERQKEYARVIGSRTIYTPQFIIGGVERIEGLDPESTLKALADYAAAQSPVTLTVTREGDRLVIRARAEPPLTEPARVELARYLPEATVDIERGENAGKTVTYRNIVTGWDSLGDWAGIEPLEISIPITGELPAVVLIQDVSGKGAKAAGPGRIFAAAVAP
ncbi:DUF1223 domain-containing protein [Pseudogemmobacter bohemicus]|uniref:DUF1223 domain-containing protein n=1 Tax=Pseudogemmobacter bohemicus TaxID=2250708 RepID=UPI001E5BBB8D|nr:DUF1223 domain-containing protein [Pseudogemmobacter bohemicus]